MKYYIEVYFVDSDEPETDYTLEIAYKETPYVCTDEFEPQTDVLPGYQIWIDEITDVTYGEVQENGIVCGKEFSNSKQFFNLNSLRILENDVDYYNLYIEKSDFDLLLIIDYDQFAPQALSLTITDLDRNSNVGEVRYADTVWTILEGISSHRNYSIEIYSDNKQISTEYTLRAIWRTCTLNPVNVTSNLIAGTYNDLWACRGDNLYTIHAKSGEYITVSYFIFIYNTIILLFFFIILLFIFNFKLIFYFV